MLRILSLVAVGLATLIFSPPAAAAGPAVGRWKIVITEQGQSIYFLVAMTEVDGKMFGDLLGSSVRLRVEPKFKSIHVKDKDVRFEMTFNGREFIHFDGVIANDGKKILGTLSQFGGPIQLTELYKSELKNLEDPFALAKENYSQVAEGLPFFDAGFTLLKFAAEKKLPAGEVKQIVDKVTQAAKGYGVRWERVVTTRVAEGLAGDKDYAEIALAQTKRLESMLTADLTTEEQLQLAGTLSSLFGKLKQPEEVKKFDAKVKELVAKDFQDYTKTMLTFTPEKFKGRKAKSDRAVLLEVFTGAECPPCTAVDLACDGLLEAFTPKDLIVLEYHVHIPGPDPLTSPVCVERVQHYGEQVRGAPTVFLNGKLTEVGGGASAEAKARYADLRAAIEPLLETPAGAKLTLTTKPGEKGATATAKVSGIAKPGEKMRLRFALTEHRVRYAGGNGIRYHHHVVRSMPGGEKGFPVTKNDLTQDVTFNVEEVRKALAQYLLIFEQTQGAFPSPDRPLDLHDLMLVAFVQNDETGEVLQAVQMPVK